MRPRILPLALLAALWGAGCDAGDDGWRRVSVEADGYGTTHLRFLLNGRDSVGVRRLPVRIVEQTRPGTRVEVEAWRDEPPASVITVRIRVDGEAHVVATSPGPYDTVRVALVVP